MIADGSGDKLKRPLLPALLRNMTDRERTIKMVWAGIRPGGRTDMHVFRMKTVSAQKYFDKVIRPLVISPVRQSGAQFIFMTTMHLVIGQIL